MIRRILNWVERNIHTGSNVSHLVQDVGCSRKKLEVTFVKQCGFSPGEYLNRRRMSRAAMLLRLTFLSITEIAVSLHFQNAQNFARSFKKFTGLTPTKYRKMEGWLTSTMQKPLLLEGVQYASVGISELPELKLHGQSSVCSHDFSSLTDKNDVTEIIRFAVSRHAAKNGNKEMCVACRLLPSVSPEEGRRMRMYVEITLQHTSNGQQEVIFPAGKYIQFNFSGSWEEYVIFTRLIYFQISEENISRRDGPDLSYFSFPDSATDDVTCRHFIPVI